MSGDGVVNLKELAKARRLRVTAVIPPQYNPIRPRLRPPLVEPRQFHSSASTLSPFDRHHDFDPLLVSALVSTGASLVSSSFRRCTAAYNEWCTPSRRRYASALFSFPASLFPPRPSPLALLLPSHIPSFISSLGVLLLSARSLA